jgi:hypothetical protein
MWSRKSLPEAVSWVKGSKAVAEKLVFRSYAYEAGQHLVGVAGSENIDSLTRLLLAANRIRGWEPSTQNNLDAWLEAGGELWRALRVHGDLDEVGFLGPLGSLRGRNSEVPRRTGMESGASPLGTLIYLHDSIRRMQAIMIRAGIPTAVAPGGTASRTTAFAPILA